MNLYTVKIITQSGSTHCTNLFLLPTECNSGKIHELLTTRFGQLKTIDDLNFVCAI